MPMFYRLTVALLAVVVSLWTTMAAAQTRPAAEPRRTSSAAQGNDGQARPTAANPRTRYAPQRTAANPAAPARGNAPTVQGQAGAARNLTPAAPFNLTPAQQQLLDQTLLRWEKQSAKVSTYVCKFVRWEIDPVNVPKALDYTLLRAEGQIKYKAPDRGEYEVEKALRWDGSKEKPNLSPDETALERWMCDGVSIYEWDSKNRQLNVRPLPANLKGKAIADGPLPFVFGAKAEQLKRRYWMRDVTPTDLVGKQIWLEARPRFQQDAANFQNATVVLDEKTFLPVALQLFPPGIAPAPGKPQAYTALQFMSPSVNNPLDKLVFLPPITPPFWRKVIVKPPEAEGAAPNARAGERVPATSRAPSGPRK